MVDTWFVIRVDFQTFHPIFRFFFFHSNYYEAQSIHVHTQPIKLICSLFPGIKFSDDLFTQRKVPSFSIEYQIT